MRIPAILSFAMYLVAQNAHGQCSCWIQPDASYTVIDNATMWNASGFNTGDDGSYGPVALPFNIHFWGQEADTVYINVNGNISLNNFLSSFTSSGFPYDTWQIIAPFWADVDLRGICGDCNTVSYKVTPTALIVNWERVGYYAQHIDRLNSFQVIITDGTDPLVPGGNNVSFCYGAMQWTTGDASGGVSGLGGTPSTVGANSGIVGDTLHYAQIGRFDHVGYDYAGPFAGSSGVTWLDSTHFYFSVADTAGVPPIFASGFDCDTVVVQVGQTLHYEMLVIAGGPGQDVAATSLCTTLPSYVELDNTQGPLAAITSSLQPEVADIGFHTVSYTAQNDFVTPLVSTATVVIEVVPDLNTGVGEVQGGSSITIYPNPVGDHLTLTLGNSMAITGAEILSMDGRVLRLLPTSGAGSMTIDVRGLAAGSYLLRTRGQNGDIISRFVKERGQ